jgi:hypothetical protein
VGVSGTHSRIEDDLAYGRLLILTKAGAEAASSFLPFRDALLVEVDAAETPQIEGYFDAVAIDHTLINDGIVDGFISAMHPEATIIVVFPADFLSVPGTLDPASLTGLDGKGLRWVAIEANRRSFCVVLRRTRVPIDSMASTSAQVSMACEAFRLGADHWHEMAVVAMTKFDAARSEVDGLTEGRRRSEQALLDHVEALLHALNVERQAHRELKAAYAAAQRRLIGRRIMRFARRVVRVLVRAGATLRRGQLPGRSRLRRLTNRFRATGRPGRSVTQD